jgi:hypothetical protein
MEHIMAEAVIIPFPKRAAAPSPVAVDDRLAGALQTLQAALAEQAQAVAEWRFAMAELGIGVAALSHSVATYDGNLAVVGDRLIGLRETAQSLEAIADTATRQ